MKTHTCNFTAWHWERNSLNLIFYFTMLINVFVILILIFLLGFILILITFYVLSYSFIYMMVAQECINPLGHLVYSSTLFYRATIVPVLQQLEAFIRWSFPACSSKWAQEFLSPLQHNGEMCGKSLGPATLTHALTSARTSLRHSNYWINTVSSRSGRYEFYVAN